MHRRLLYKIIIYRCCLVVYAKFEGFLFCFWCCSTDVEFKLIKVLDELDNMLFIEKHNGRMPVLLNIYHKRGK